MQWYAAGKEAGFHSEKLSVIHPDMVFMYAGTASLSREPVARSL